jgi:hypothetical protein
MDPKTQPNPNDILTGGARVRAAGEEVTVREITPADILDGKYLRLLREDYAALLDWLCGKPAGWAKSLGREDWTALREAEERVNFSFALAETKAAFERGQALKFVDEAIVAQSRQLMELMGSLGLSANTAAPADAAAPKPSPSPCPGS